MRSSCTPRSTHSTVQQSNVSAGTVCSRILPAQLTGHSTVEKLLPAVLTRLRSQLVDNGNCITMLYIAVQHCVSHERNAKS